MSARSLFTCLLFVLTVLVSGCGPVLRSSLSPQELLSARAASDRLIKAELQGLMPRLVVQAKQKYDDYVRDLTPEPPQVYAFVY